MNRFHRQVYELPSHLKCPSCNFRFQYPALKRKEDADFKEPFRIPYVLSCGHSYCLSCLKNQVRSSPNVFCSICQKSSHVIGELSEVLPLDFNIIGRCMSARAELYDRTRMSSLDCDEGNENDFLCKHCCVSPARCICLDCFVNYCNPCFQNIHSHSSPIFKQHTAIPLCKSGIFESPTPCKIHTRQFIDMHCITCKQRVCTRCDHHTREHKDHEMSTFNEMFRKNLNQLQALPTKVESLLQTFQQMSVRNSSIGKDTIENEVRRRFCQLHGILLQKEEEVIRLCLSSDTATQGVLHKHVQFLSHLAKDLNTVLRVNPDKIDVPVNYDGIVAQLNYLEKLASRSERQFSENFPNLNLNAAKFENLLNQCIKGPKESLRQFDSTSSSAESKSFDGILSERASAVNVVEVFSEPTEKVDCKPEADSNSSVSSAPSRRKECKKINCEVSYQYLTDLEHQPPSFVNGSLATGDKVFVSHVVNPSNLYVQKQSDSEQIQSLFNVCQGSDKSDSISQEAFNALDPGDMVLAQFSLDSCWYRSRILCTHAICGGTKCPRGSVRVIFVDYGNCENVRVHQVKSLSPQLENIADFGYNCNLYILPVSRSWHKSTGLVIRDIVESQLFAIHVLEQKTGGVFVDLVRPLEQGRGAFSLREHLVLTGNARFPDGASHPMSDFRSEGTDQSLRDDNSQSFSLDSTTLPPTPISDLHQLPVSMNNCATNREDCVSDVQLESTLSDNVPITMHTSLLSTNSDALNAALAEAFEDGTLRVDEAFEELSNPLTSQASCLNALESESDVEEVDENVLANEKSTQIDLPDGSFVDAICISNETIISVWVTPTDPIQAMAFPDNHSALKGGCGFSTAPKIGGLYAARYNDGLFYRCVVEALMGQYQARVFFVDFGNREMVTWKNEMLLLSKHFLAKPYMARALPLAGITFTNKLVTHELINKVEDIITGNTYQIRYERTLEGGTKESDAVFFVQSDSCANLELVELGLADFTSPVHRTIMRTLATAAQAQFESNTKTRDPSSADTFHITPEVPSFHTRETKKVGRRARKMNSSSVVGMMNVDPALTSEESVWEDDLSENDAARLPLLPSCRIQRVISPGEFYVCMSDSDSLNEFDRLCQAMDDHYKASKPGRSMSDIAFGKLCACRRSNSEHWFRGRILGPSPNGPGRVKVEFLDVGDVLNIPKASIRQPLDSALVTGWPSFAVRCRLLGVRPAGDNPDAWPRAASEKLHSLVKRSAKTAFVSKVAEEENGLAVDLIIQERKVDSDTEEDKMEDITRPSRLISMRKAMLSFGVVLARSYDPSLSTRLNDLILKGLSLDASSLSVSIHGDSNVDDFVLSSSEEDSTLEDHLYQQSNNSTVPVNSPLKVDALKTVELMTPCDLHKAPSSLGELVCDPTELSTLSLNVTEGIEMKNHSVMSESSLSTNPASYPNIPIQSPPTTSQDDESLDPKPLYWAPQNLSNMDSDDGFEVCVLSVDKDLTFYCKPFLEKNLKAIEIRANSQTDHLRLPPKRTIKDWHINEACLVFWQEESQSSWCRGQFHSFDYLTDIASVYLIDYDVSIKVTNELLRPIDVSTSETPHPYLTIPPVVLRVKLHCLHPVNLSEPDDMHCKLWHQSILDYVQETIVMRVVTLFVIEVEENTQYSPIFHGRLLCTEIGNGEEFGDHLCHKDIAYRWWKTKDQLFVKNPIQFLCYPVLDPIPVGVRLEVMVTAVETPCEIYLQYPISSRNLTALCHEWSEHSHWFGSAQSAHNFLQSIDLEDFSSRHLDVNLEEVPVPCLARYSADSLFYRAEIVRRVMNSCKFRVHFVDYGNFDDVDEENLRFPAFLPQPACCRRYQWRGVKRHPKCSLTMVELTNKILETLEPMVIFAKCEKIYKDGRLPLVDLYEDFECSKSLVDNLEEQELIIRE